MWTLAGLLIACPLLVQAAHAAAGAISSSRPNILLAIADDWSYGHAGAYGCRWVNTPGIDRVARDGILFTRTYTPNAKCAPSRACILTGRNSWQLKDACNHVCFYPPEFKSYVEALSEQGYFVGSTGKTWGPGIAKDLLGRTRHMAGTPFNQRQATPPALHISNNDYSANFVDFLDAAPADVPWCFWYGTTEPHRAYESGAGRSKAQKKLADIERVPAFWADTETVRDDMLDYAFEVEHFDRHLVRILDTLRRRGQLENTLVVVTSDHGMPFPRCKGQAYDYSNHVPLAIMWPRGLQGTARVVDDYVSFIDLAPTFLEVAGVDPDVAGMQPITGRSLVEILRANASGQIIAERDHVLIGKERHDVGRPGDAGYPIRGIVKNGMLYLRNYEPSRWPAGNPETGYLNCDGSPTKTHVLQGRLVPERRRFWELCFGRRPSEELYNVVDDPDCVHNLAAEDAHQELRESLRQQMLAELTQQGDPRAIGQAEYFDTIRFANPSTTNFYERFLKGEKLNAGWVNDTDFESQPVE